MAVAAATPDRGADVEASGAVGATGVLAGEAVGHSIVMNSRSVGPNAASFITSWFLLLTASITARQADLSTSIPPNALRIHASRVATALSMYTEFNAVAMASRPAAWVSTE